MPPLQSAPFAVQTISKHTRNGFARVGQGQQQNSDRSEERDRRAGNPLRFDRNNTESAKPKQPEHLFAARGNAHTNPHPAGSGTA